MSLNNLSVADQEQAQIRMVGSDHWHTCLNCTHFDEEASNSGCQKFLMMPPLAVIVVGCHVWEDHIPF